MLVQEGKWIETDHMIWSQLVFALTGRNPIEHLTCRYLCAHKYADAGGRAFGERLRQPGRGVDPAALIYDNLKRSIRWSAPCPPACCQVDSKRVQARYGLNSR